MVLTGLVTRLVVHAFGLLLPAYQAFKLLAAARPAYPDPALITPLLRHFAVVAFFLSTEWLIDWVLFWLPLYYELKLAVLVWALVGGGAQTLYDVALAPYLTRREAAIDATIQCARREMQSRAVVGFLALIESVKGLIFGLANKLLQVSASTSQSTVAAATPAIPPPPMLTVPPTIAPSAPASILPPSNSASAAQTLATLSLLSSALGSASSLATTFFTTRAGNPAESMSGPSAATPMYPTVVSAPSSPPLSPTSKSPVGGAPAPPATAPAPRKRPSRANLMTSTLIYEPGAPSSSEREPAAPVSSPVMAVINRRRSRQSIIAAAAATMTPTPPASSISSVDENQIVMGMEYESMSADEYLGTDR